MPAIITSGGRFSESLYSPVPPARVHVGLIDLTVIYARRARVGSYPSHLYLFYIAAVEQQKRHSDFTPGRMHCTRFMNRLLLLLLFAAPEPRIRASIVSISPGNVRVDFCFCRERALRVTGSYPDFLLYVALDCFVAFLCVGLILFILLRDFS